MVSINDVAAKANVSISTVSRVMNQNANVSKEKERAVLAAVEELDYIPNGLARGLVTKNTNSVGILIADIANMYYASLVKSIEKTLNQKGYYTIVGNTEWDKKREENYLRYLMQKQVDGFILASTALDEKYIDKLTKKGIPMVVLDREIESDLIDKIRINDYDGAYQATAHLVDYNYDYFLHIAGPKKVATALDRSKGFSDALKDNNISSQDYKILEGSFREESGVQKISDFLAGFELKDRRVGIFAANDSAAFGIMKELKDRQLNVPGQFGVIGFDDVNFSRYADPPLTTISRPIKEIGEITASILMDRIENLDNEKYSKKNITLDVNLIKRGSTSRLR
ncbi:LacI family DNA-binding transcriptional regulator [Halanaerobium hydrogeniformans]|uniref:Transcriptional regulator, LacI family n=1 Tax=Halanaerobium hydrogeniformans TaxID=656519 RepID=E4RL87_HALHG|nr:LacI family DNA-binding transcriptional regulator [Halanaerobium hydrogeniformans]ADQ15768.1 transcriptional regulator, LacI family [Halanaerobium hydrogeniformans]